MPRPPDLEKQARYRALFAKGLTAREVAARMGVTTGHAEKMRAALNLSAIPPAPPRSDIDNALTAAFRKVVGFCPHRDGVRRGHEPL